MNWSPEQRAKCRIVGTPIGNLSDLSERARSALFEATIVFAEDTRTAKALLNYLNISKPLKSYYKDNEVSQVKHAVSAVMRGEKVVLISEAGMPAISDPGYLLIKTLLEKNIAFEIVPGANAAVTAAAASGLCSEGRYLFYGFLSVKGIREELEKLSKIPYPIVFYESPKRVTATIKLMLEFFRAPIAVAKELTKFYEEIFWIHNEGDLAKIRSRGEFCIVTQGGIPSKEIDDMSELIQFLKEKEFSTKDITTVLKMFGVKRNIAYSASI